MYKNISNVHVSVFAIFRCGEDKLEKYLEKFNKTSSMDQDLDSSEKEPVSKTNEFVPINTSTCEEDIGGKNYVVLTYKGGYLNV